MAKESGIRLIANNKKAYHDYFIEDTYEAGIELAGTEGNPCAWESAALKNPLSRLSAGKFLFMECTSAPMRKEIFLTKTL